jgi:hypothetical protein
MDAADTPVTTPLSLMAKAYVLASPGSGGTAAIEYVVPVSRATVTVLSDTAVLSDSVSAPDPLHPWPTRMEIAAVEMMILDLMNDLSSTKMLDLTTYSIVSAP